MCIGGCTMIENIAIQLCFDRCETRFPMAPQEENEISMMHEGTIIWKKEEYTYRTYMWYYSANGGCMKKYDHLQAVTVLYDFELHEPSYVFFHASFTDNTNGIVLPWDKCKKTDEGALKVYVAKRGHASYPEPGIFIQCRIGCRIDIARGNGRAITYRRFQTVLDDHIECQNGTVNVVAMRTLPVNNRFFRMIG